MVGIDEANVAAAFTLTILAGLATGIGSALAFFSSKTNTRFLSVALGFSAGVMIYVSFVEILAKSKTALTASLGPYYGAWGAVLSFFGGIALIALIDRLVPTFENPHEMHVVEEMAGVRRDRADNGRLMRMGVLSALAIGIHNFPEGLATFAATMQSPSLGGAIALAIGIHNVPEGIAVSVPVYFATGSRKKAFGLSFLSGISEPAGALIGYFLLRSFFNETIFGILFGMVAGIMVFISFDQLLPTAEEYGEHHLALYGLIAGMVVMAVSLLLFL